MKTFVELPAMYEGAKARRLSKVGRIELLRVIEEPPYWFVRIVGFQETRDRPRLERCGSGFGNGYWRFGYYEAAVARFKELASQPESIKEQKEGEILREKQKQRYQERVRAGTMVAFKKSAQKTPDVEQGTSQ
jgi:hypothetical protein